MNKLKKKLSTKIESFNEDIDLLKTLNFRHKTINLNTRIKELQKQRNDLIITQNYLDECELELSNKLEEWLNKECTGTIEIKLI